METFNQWLGYWAVLGGAFLILVSTGQRRAGQHNDAIYNLILGIWAMYVGLL